MQNVTQILHILEETTGYKPEYDPEKRAAIIARENMNPVIMARKEKAAKELLQKWEQWGLIKLS